VPGFEAVVRASVGRLQDQLALQPVLDKARPMDVRSPALARAWKELLRTLDAPEEVPLHVTEGEGINGFTLGVRHPHVMLTEGAVRDLPLREVQIILAHELGHVLSGHVMYKSMVRLLDAGRWALLSSGINLALTLPVLLALLHWDRKSELSADRAEVLAVGDPVASVAVLRRCELGQGDRARAQLDRLAELWKPGADAVVAVERAFSRHPPIEERIAGIQAWAESEALAAIRAGEYPRRGTDGGETDRFEARVGELGEGLRAQVEAAKVRGNAVLDWLQRKSGGEPEER